MSTTNPADLILTLKKATEGFTALLDRPMDTDIIDIRQLLLPILMKTNNDELTLTQNRSGFFLPTERYEHLYSKGGYLILPVIALYNARIDKDVTITEFR